MAEPPGCAGQSAHVVHGSAVPDDPTLEKQVIEHMVMQGNKFAVIGSLKDKPLKWLDFTWTFGG